MESASRQAFPRHGDLLHQQTVTGIPVGLGAAQKARFAALDARLPPAAGPPEGERLDAFTPQGRPVSAILQRLTHPPGSFDLLWSAAEVWQLFPFIGDTGTDGMDALLRAAYERLGTETPGPDSSCTVNWPSHDAEAIRAFLDHGFVPISTLAVRAAPAPPSPSTGLTVRRAEPADFDDVLELAVSTFDYTGLVGSPKRANTAELLAPQLRRKLTEGYPIWLAEQHGTAAGMADCGWIDSAPGSSTAELLPPGRWGYVNNAVTSPQLRGGGVGQALMSLVHNEFHREGAVGTYLYYNPPNPLSSVFWHRQGYRPLWTLWEIRPASALR
jgi:GNAT superfamily N-acetyltransferase